MLTMLVLLAQQVSVGAIPPGTPAQTVAITVPVVRADGSAAGVTSAPLAEGSIYYISTAGGLCTAMTIGAAEPKAAGYGWRVTAPQVTRTPTGVTVKLEWQRMWERGSALAEGPRGETQLTLRREERIPLDQIVGATESSCDASSIAAELWAYRTLPGGGGVGGGGVATGARAGGRAAAVAPVPVPVPVNLSRGFDVELWLVDRSRDGAETVQPLIVRSSDGSPRFFFRPRRISTPSGFALMEVTGQIRSLPLGDGTTRLLVSLARRIEGDAVGGNATTGSTARVIAVPEPDEVISFDLPGLAGPRGSATAPVDPLNGHTFSVRMRIGAK